jgi:hypothetical protein
VLIRVGCASVPKLMTGALFLVALACSAVAEETSTPKAFTCTFTDGASGSYASGSFKTVPPAPLVFDIEKIDLEGHTAVLRTGPDGGSGTVRIVRAINANHFLEVAMEGFLNLTTVYDKDASTGTYPAVHSRHFGLLGQPVFGQYTGYCHAK